MRAAWMGGLMALGLVVGCDAESCPPDYPVEREGFCYRDDGGMAPGDDAGGGGSEMDAGITEDAGAPDDASAPVDAAPICTGTHPLLDGARRYCEPGDCFCADPDNCFPEEIAEACCEVAVTCGDADAGAADGGGVICTGTHPLLDGTRRYCEAGDCYCADPDACFPAEIAASCCGVDVVCE